jgi:Uma2 family endonuclease
VAFERTSNVKHEFWSGQIYAMAGGTPEHAALAASVSGLLFAQLDVGACRVYSSDLRVRAGDLVTYPDVTVICGSPVPDSRDASTTLNPVLVVEVTSPSTERYDRAEKLALYQQVPTLQAVLLVAHDQCRLELWTRGSDTWQFQSAGPGERIELSAVGVTLAVQDVYGRAGIAPT